MILLILTSLTLLITYFYYFKYKDLIFEQLTISKNRILYGSKENTKPNLIILGNRYINSKSLIHELDTNLNSTENKNDLSLISNILKKKKLIKKFIITKTSENLLTIKIEEKNIIGLTKIKNSHYLIDEFNNLIEEKITPKLFHLPFFNGKNSYKNANVILSLIRKSDVSINYISFSFIDNRRWNINLNNGVKILLPENNIIDTLLSTDTRATTTRSRRRAICSILKTTTCSFRNRRISQRQYFYHAKNQHSRGDIQ